MKSGAWSLEDLETVPNCPVCGCARRTLLYANLTDDVYGVDQSEWSLYSCTSCRTAWLDPRPNKATIGKAYDNYVTHIAENDISIQPKSWLVRLLHSWITDYKNSRYGLKRSPSARFGRLLVWLVPSIRAKADSQCRHLPKLVTSGKRLLDVGFGNGGFLKLAGEMGWQAEGIDFDAKAVEVARAQGLSVECASVDELIQQNAEYDVVTLSHVIEHVYDPNVLLENIFRLLKPDGILWIETPNMDSYGARRFQRNWRGLEPPRHLSIFNPYSLALSLENAGFRKIQTHWHGMIPLTMYPASMAISRGELAQGSAISYLPSFPALVAEFMSMLRPSRREFLTFTARKLP